MISSEFLSVLVCPETRQGLKLADEGLLSIVQTKVNSGSLFNRAGNIVEGPVSGVLIREDGEYCYISRDEIPILLIEESVSLDSIK